MEHREREQLYRQLGRQQLFQGVSLDAVEYLVEDFARQDFEAGAMILQRDRENRRLYLLLQGEVAVHLDSHEKAPLYQLGAGECFGEMSLIDGGIASATVVAQAACQCLVVAEDALWEMVHRSHAIARNLLFILTRRVRNTNETISASIEALQRWEAFAFTDALTGLRNRRWLDEHLEGLVGSARESGQPMSVLMLDVDRFKDYNDRWGHAGGDQALRTVGSTLASSVRDDEHAARYGGEELLVLLPGAEVAQAVARAEALRSAIARSPCGQHGEAKLPPVTVSVGISELAQEEPPEAFIVRADEALYRAKTGGRNRIVVHGAWGKRP